MQLKYDKQLSAFCYEMTVTPVDNAVRKYRSVKILSEFSADAIRGRATRSLRHMRSTSMVNELKDPKRSPSKTTDSTPRVKPNQ